MAASRSILNTIVAGRLEPTDNPAKTRASVRRRRDIGSCCFGRALVVVICNMPKSLVVAFCFSFAACQQNTAESRLEQGPYTVHYSIRQSDGSTSGIGSPVADVERIRFHDRYVVLQKKEGSGQLLPVDGLVEFRWSKRK